MPAPRRALVTLLVAVAAALTALAAWPAALGGHTTYLTVRGSSMNPGLHDGDLAVIRPAKGYDIGDVAAYRSQVLDGSVVLHRIVDRHGDRLVLQGDNNPFLDRDRPTEAEIIGALTGHLPAAGSVLSVARSSLPFAAGLSVVAAVARSRRPHRPTRPTRLSRKGPPPMPRRSPSPLIGTAAWRNAAVALAALTAACAVLGGVALSRPLEVAASEPATYHHRGRFDYTAPAPTGPVYGGALEAGDPVFLRLVDAVDLSFEYRLDAPAADVTGSIGLDAVVTDSSGWERTVELARPVPLARASGGSGGRVTGRLDLPRLRADIAEVRAATGVADGPATVTVAPDVRIEGRLGGAPVEDRFLPGLTFQLDSLQLRLLDVAATTSEIAPGDEGSADPLRPVERRSLDRVVSRPARIEAFGIVAPVAASRTWSLAVGVPAALAAMAAGLVLRSRLGDEVARITLRHGHHLVPVAGAEPQGGGVSVEVTTMSDLARLAEQHGSLILHRQTGAGHEFVMQADRVLYRYHARRAGPRSAAG